VFCPYYLMVPRVPVDDHQQPLIVNLRTTIPLAFCDSSVISDEPRLPLGHLFSKIAKETLPIITDRDPQRGSVGLISSTKTHQDDQ
jgi:hypothetical protein